MKEMPGNNMMLKEQIRSVASRGLLAVALFMPVAAQNTQQSSTPVASQPTNQQSQNPQDAGFTIKSSVDRVLVNVVVRDKKGNLVRDMKREELTILEDGKPQKFTSFDFESIETAGPALAQATSGSVGAQRIIGNKTAPPPDFKSHRLVILFFDFNGAQEEEIDREVDAGLKYVDKQMTAADTVAVVSFNTVLKVDQDFTSDKDLVKKSLQKYSSKSGAGFDAGGTGDTEGTADNGNAFTADDSDFNTFNQDRKLAALESLMHSLERIEQKKSIIYFTDFSSGNGPDNQAQLRSTVNAAVKANVAIYTVDPKGLEALPPGGDASTASTRGVSAFNGGRVAAQFSAKADAQEMLTSLAEDTGGKAFLDTNDFSPVFDKVQQDTSAYYILTYKSNNPLMDGNFRKITVKTSRPDVKLEFRTGYYASKDFKHFSAEDKEAQLEKELNSDLTTTDVPVYMSVAYFRMNDDRYFVPVSLIIPGSAIPFTRAADKDKATIDIVGVVREVNTKFPIGTAKETIKLNIDGAQEVKRKNVQYNTGFLLVPGHYKVKFVIRENQTGQIGSFETEIVVPDFKKQKTKMLLSSIVIGGQLQANTRKARDVKDNPLVRDGQELIPSVNHVFTNDQHAYFYYEVYEPGKPAKVDAPATAANGGQAAGAATPPAPPQKPATAKVLSSVTFFNGKTKVYETPMIEVRELGAPDRKAAIFQLDVPLSQLKPGYYVCQVNVIDDAAGNFIFPRFAILVKDATPKAAAPVVKSSGGL